MNRFRPKQVMSQPSSDTGLRRFFDAGTTAGRISRLAALGATGAALVVAAPSVVVAIEGDSGPALGTTFPATDQYAEQITICDRSDGQTLRLTVSQAAPLLDNGSAARGPC